MATAQKIAELTALAKGAPDDLLVVVDDPDDPGKITRKFGFGTFLKTYNRSAAEISEGLSNDDLDFKENEGHVLRYGDNPIPGTTIRTAAFQTAIDVITINGGVVNFGENNLVDTLNMKDNVHLKGNGPGSILSFVAHTLTHNPVIRIGGPNTDLAPAGGRAGALGVGPITGTRLSNFKIDGNSASQTGGGDEFSPGVHVWQSEYNNIEDLIITDCKGDGVTIGFDNAQKTGSDGNTVKYCEIFNNLSIRQAIAITFGNENQFLFNRISGRIDLEINLDIGECKNNLVHGNTGRTQTESLLAPRISDLSISTATLDTNPLHTSGNTITDNHCFEIIGQFNDSLTVKGNTVVGSTSGQTFLMDFAAVNNLLVDGNILIANVAVATSLTELLRTRAGQHVTVTNNTGDDGGLPFHQFQSTFGAEPSADGHVFKNNNFDGGGDYRSGGGTPFITEESVYKLETDGANPQVFTYTHISGPFLPLTGSSSGANLVLNIGWAEAKQHHQVEIFPYGETGAAAEPYDHTVIASVDISGSNRVINVFTAPLNTTLAYLQYNYAAGGTQGTIFLRLRY